MKPPPKTWDIFCHVVDNYGDIGVCWRLARQLRSDHGAAVRLWVDDLDTFRRIEPRLDVALPRQIVEGVQIRHWASPFPAVEPADVTLEAFACELPASHVAAMARRTPRPVWINLEYLSAESWVEECHGLPSPQPGGALLKHFFIPGFAERSGGLLRERGLARACADFQANRAAQDAFWRSLGVPPRLAGEERISLFCYPQASLGELLECWSAAQRPTTLLVPEGVATQALRRFLAAPAPRAGQWRERAQLRICAIPFLDLDRFDRLLWASDCNFVRGEDSFVRAQWARHRLVWQAYAQADAAHLKKLEAFLGIYLAGLPAGPAGALADFWRAWNTGKGVAEAWPAFAACRDALENHARSWAERLGRQEDLASRLVKFCADPL